MKTLSVRITGRVQGVGYRVWAEAEARSRNLSGWVRNRRDGSVEALLQGPPQRVEELIAWARRGPPDARVDDLRIDLPDAEPRCSGFERRPTI